MSFGEGIVVLAIYTPFWTKVPSSPLSRRVSFCPAKNVRCNLVCARWAPSLVFDWSHGASLNGRIKWRTL